MKRIISKTYFSFAAILLLLELQVDTLGQNIPVSGGSVHIRIYTPKAVITNYPLVLYIHGGLSYPRIDLTKADLKGLPPTTIITAAYDPIQSDGQMLRDKLQAAGVDVTGRYAHVLMN